MSAPATDLRCRAATMADAGLLWGWVNDPETRHNSFGQAAIPWREHVAWLERGVGSATTRLWIFSDRGGPVGQVRCEAGADGAELHIAVAPESRARGYGTAMLAHAVRLARETFGDRVPLLARVLERNEPSLRLFRACGFRATGAVEGTGGDRAIVFEFTGTPPSLAAGVQDSRGTR